MSVSEQIAQVFQDLYFRVVSAFDESKQLMFDLAGATTGKTVTIQSNHTTDRTLKLPNKDGTLDTIESVRTILGSNTLNYATAEIVYRELSANETLSITGPVAGKVVTMELDPNGFNYLFPPSCKILSGKIKPETINYIYFHCIDEAAPTYIVTIGQQSA